MPTIYLSSTYEDLKDFRSAVVHGLRQSEYRVIAMEDYVATDQRPVDKCLKDVENADIYVGVFAFRYGYIPPSEHNNPNGFSITELELRHAQSLRKPCLMFLADQKTTGFPPTLVDAFTGDGEAGKYIKRLRDQLSCEQTTSFFSAPYHLASLVQAALTSHLSTHNTFPSSSTGQVYISEVVTWDIEKNGSPYPGLMHFTSKYAPVFFGRDVEVREMLDRMREPEGRFLLISGASGSGKSSLIDAGVLPRIEKNGIVEGKKYRCVRIVPSRGNHPFDALLRPLHTYAERAGFDAYQLGEQLFRHPEKLSQCLCDIVAKGLDADALVLFLDQMEELFTVCDQAQSQAFVSSLYQATRHSGLWVVATIRSDFLQYCHEHTDLLMMLNGRGYFGLGPIDELGIREMIINPARCAGLRISERLVRRLVTEAGQERGSLPLLAFALRQLFEQRVENELTETAFDQLGGLAGAIRGHVITVENKIIQSFVRDDREVFSKIFAPLVVVTIDRKPTRRWASKEKFDSQIRSVIDGLIEERLLTAAEGQERESLISVANEKLFEGWPRLAAWIETNREKLFILRQAEIEAGEWERYRYDLNYLWPEERLKKLQEIIEDLGHEQVNNLVQRYASPQQILIERLHETSLPHSQRLRIGLYLAVLGDPRSGVGVYKNGLPDIVWVDIPGGQVKLEGVEHVFVVKPFRIAKYPITNAQFEVFLAAKDGYGNEEWWEGIELSHEADKPSWQEANAPRENVSWYEAVAFCRWLSVKTDTTIRLPTEWEWQQAATGGEPKREYPWEGGWDVARCNCSESRLSRTAPVGMYPAGITTQGVHDMAYNVWEWCLNSYEEPEQPRALCTDVRENNQRVLRGGSWNVKPGFLRSSFRFRYTAPWRDMDIGFRLAQDIDQ